MEAIVAIVTAILRGIWRVVSVVLTDDPLGNDW